ncbi:MAG: redoxin domain-containing protein [Thermoplasmataceae archaeon]|jgi:peroxiredoxin|nr:redoxin domain-containing protein [Candidatus Thermoplasmatota archaeon]
MVELNSKAPDFKLIDSNLKQKTLADYKGNKTVLLFFPGAFTGVCTKEMCTFRDSMSKFNNLKAKVVGISVDQPFSLAQFAKENNLNFDLLSDATREVSKKYDSLHHDFVNVPGLTASKRSVFILDQNGIVKYKWISENPGVEPNYAEIEKELAKF